MLRPKEKVKTIQSQECEVGTTLEFNIATDSINDVNMQQYLEGYFDEEILQKIEEQSQSQISIKDSDGKHIFSSQLEESERRSNGAKSINALKYSIITCNRTMSQNKAFSSDREKNKIKSVYKPNIIQLVCLPKCQKRPQFYIKNKIKLNYRVSQTQGATHKHIKNYQMKSTFQELSFSVKGESFNDKIIHNKQGSKQIETEERQRPFISIFKKSSKHQVYELIQGEGNSKKLKEYAKNIKKMI